MKQHQRAFTLIELMVSVAIIGILAAIAYPSYQANVISSQEAEARAALMSLAAELSQFHMEGNTFEGAFLGEGGIFPNTVPLNGGRKYYDLVIINQTDTTFQISAIPSNTERGLTTYTLDELGNRTPACDQTTGTGWC